MKKLIFIATLILCALAVAFPVLAAEVTLSWDANPEPDIAGYKVYQSTDLGANWTEVADTNATSISLFSVPDSGLVLFRVSARDAQDETVRYNAGAWHNGDWLPPGSPKGSGIE